MLGDAGATYGLHLALMAAIGLIAGAGVSRLVTMSESPEWEGGYFTAQVSEEYAGAIALTSGESIPGMRRLLARMLTGNPNVNPDFTHDLGSLSAISDRDPAEALPTSVNTARAVAASMLGLENHLYLGEGPESELPGPRVIYIDGKEASVEVWESSLKRRVAAVISEGVSAVSGMTSTLTLEDGETVEVRYGSVMVALHALPPGRLAAAGRELHDPGQVLTSERLYRVIPDVRLIIGPAGTPDGHAKAPHNTDGPSAGLAYMISYLNAHTSGGLLGGTTVAASGTIDIRGNIGPVGGFPAKEMAAAHSGAEILLVPEGTPRTSRPSSRMEVIEVRSAQEAVYHLCIRTATEEMSTSSICAASMTPDARSARTTGGPHHAAETRSAPVARITGYH